MQWRIAEGETQGPIIVDNKTSPEVEKFHSFDLQDYGEQPVFCREGEFIDVCIRSVTSAHRFGIMWRGTEDQYSAVEGQDYDFRVERSPW
jgi:hypothetical protein